MNAARVPRRARGFTLVELMVVLVVLVALAAVTWPAFRNRTLQAGRIDAVQALTKIQGAQEQYRALHGMYADDLSALQGAAAVSNQGLYALSMERTAPEAFLATATARGRQADDGACKELTLRVMQGFPTEGPSQACWQR